MRRFTMSHFIWELTGCPLFELSMYYGLDELFFNFAYVNFVVCFFGVLGCRLRLIERSETEAVIKFQRNFCLAVNSFRLTSH